MRERADESRVKLWVLTEANRLLVVALFLAVVIGLLLAVGLLVPDPVGFLEEGDPIETAFQSFIGATITGVTIVVTLTQLVLSQELGAVGDQRERMQGAMQFREDTAELFDTPVSPPEPADFLRSLLSVTHDRAETLRDSAGDDNRLADLAQSVAENAEGVRDSLSGARFGQFEVISAGLNFNYSWKLYAARRLRAEGGGGDEEEGAGGVDSDDGTELSADQQSALDDLIEALELFGPTREHFKTLYFQWELIDLSRVILVASIPALLVSSFMVLYYEVGSFPALVPGVPTPVLVVSLAVGFAVLPFAVLLSYVLRIATVAKRTLSIGPFVLRTTDDGREFDWD
nr:hypothetical protein [Salinirubrum litoreum]